MILFVWLNESATKYTMPHLSLMQAIGGGGQGWVNAILYIFLSSTIRTRLFNPRRYFSKTVQDTPSTTHFSPPISSNYKTFSSSGLLFK